MIKQGKISFRVKNKLLVCGVLLLCALGYLVSLRPNLKLRDTNSALSEQLAMAKSAPERIELLAKQASSYNLQAAEFSDSKEDVQKSLLQLISKATATFQVALVELTYFGTTEQNGVSVENFRISLEGSFQGLTRSIHFIEDELKGAQLVSVLYEKRKVKAGKGEVLIGSLVIQSIIRHEN